MVGYASPGLQYFQSEYRWEDWAFKHYWAAGGNILYKVALPASEFPMLDQVLPKYVTYDSNAGKMQLQSF